ncbi:uncharacterized protein CMU_012740 [Cryptosporidium muris RN66]|uniref:Diphthine--ammonia ligase n=1 Tax=Cryptosporidium muris (strain RN66) TaxID=441375 RepID=B6AEI3_CRYMR|nr:uncharacterized protein CMU_012740 [Cryptosporidium muris RN66]EEA06600.1 hypothetical protein, conserved [Cryptosporidium muris RN66]|eukprot:XP_002140949.1 hypothetical protein [Cryptosporidium muris RN66]
MKIVGLISGGKDSMFNLMCCKYMGHEIEVVAHMNPPENSLELDSYMYQSIGKELIPMVAECLEIPLIQFNIKGKPINKEMQYISTYGDEVEDLYKALKYIKENYPYIEGISCGAIMSNYQRCRLEEIAARLDLECLCYLWMLPEVPLLYRMIESGLESIVIKVAAYGLNDSFLAKSIEQNLLGFLNIQDNICRDFHCCGEGGEFETITINAPKILYPNKMISIERFERICLDNNPLAPVYVIKPNTFYVKDKDNQEKVEDDKDIIPLPFLNDKYCLEYYLLRTGIYLNPPSSFRRTSSKLQLNNNNNTYYEDDIFCFIIGKRYFINWTSLSLEISNNYCLVDILKQTLGFYENWQHIWTPISYYIIIPTLILSKYDKEQIFKKIKCKWYEKLVDLCPKWNPIIIIDFDNTKKEIHHLMIFQHIEQSIDNCNIQNRKLDNSFKFLTMNTSTSYSSYGYRIPRPFSTALILSNNNFSAGCNDIKSNLFILSSPIPGVIPHSDSAPTLQQIKYFDKTKESINSTIEICDHNLCVQLSLALRSYRCNFSSSLYSAAFLSFGSHNLKADIFNSVSLWIIRIDSSKTNYGYNNQYIDDIINYFKSLIIKYSDFEIKNFEKKEDWSTIHNFSKKYDKYNNQLDPLIVCVKVPGIPSSSICSIQPLAIYNPINNNIEKHSVRVEMWDIDVRLVYGISACCIFRSNTTYKDDILSQPDLGESTEIYKKLVYCIEQVCYKSGLSIEDLIFSTFFIRPDITKFVNNWKYVDSSVSKIIKSTNTVCIEDSNSSLILVLAILV